ncbi:hypothetical protein MHM88_14400 [Epibacterium sp. MM17-32]|uniref:hypothetical protein n=1 Tax=Epibacterium sp. MM17-32 TaxID=2917734 RepID=UPI001EF5FD6B|nr:hypothetical protein [Epibacterium sp. MM17-32]MCG7628999.1 hypothetical protein [Epibacterium sp. MM17-32]
MPFDFSLTDVPRQSVEAVVGKLKADSQHDSREAAAKLIAQAREAGLGLRDYLTLAVDPRAGEHSSRFLEAGLNGYEATLDYLNLPFHNDLEQGVLLQAASDTFQTFPGTRALFPEVVDDMVRWKDRQDQFESTENLVGQSRTIAGVEMVSTVVEDDSAERGTFIVPELANIPVRTIRTSQTSVGMFKHGSAYRTSYEFNRRASLDILTPFAARVQRQLEISKVTAAVSVLINGDGVNPAAPTKNLSEYGADFTNGKTLKDNYRALAKFIMDRARAGNPVDTLVGNFDTYVELMFMFMPTLNNKDGSDIEKIAAIGGPSLQLPIMGGSVKFAIASAMPANTILAYSKGETLEELVEAGAAISENEQSITNQALTYVRTEVTGYKLAFGDTRTLLMTNA